MSANVDLVVGKVGATLIQSVEEETGKQLLNGEKISARASPRPDTADCTPPNIASPLHPNGDLKPEVKETSTIASAPEKDSPQVDNFSVSEELSCAAKKDIPEPGETLDSSIPKIEKFNSSGELENFTFGHHNSNSLFESKEFVTETEIPQTQGQPVLRDFKLTDSNGDFSEPSLLEGSHVLTPEFSTDPTEDSKKFNVSSDDPPSTMKGEVLVAPMPIPETRSPMIHIPASIVSEFMNSESSLSPVTAKPLKVNNNSHLNTDTYVDNFTKSNISGDETTVINGSSKSVGVTEKPQEETMEVGADLKNGELSSAPLIGSTPPDSRPAKPASPASLSNLAISVSSAQCDSTGRMDTSNDPKSSEKSESSPLTNGACESSSLCPTPGPLADVSSFESNSATLDHVSRTLLTPLAGTVATPVSLNDHELPQSTDITELAPVKSRTSNSNLTTSTSTSSESTSESNRNLKRSLPTQEDKNNKKLRLSPGTEDSDKATEIETINDNAVVEAEVEKLKHTASKLRKMKRKDLENMIIELFMNKVLHNHELGKYKSLCEKLESTLDSNRKKAAQLHKELDDLRKVTKKLQEEHENRKDHLVTPIKIKRSVGIQAAPHIIQKGIAAACAESSKTKVRPSSAQSNGTTSQPSVLTNSSVETSSPLCNSSQNSLGRQSFNGGRVVGGASGNPADRRGCPQPLTSQMTSSNKSNAVIDLTDEEESRTSAVTSIAPQVFGPPQNVIKTAVTNGLLPLPTNSGPAQYVLVPSSNTSAGNTVVVAAANMGTNLLGGPSNSSPRLLLPNSSVMNSKPSSSGLLGSPAALMIQQQLQPSPHPAPLPRTAPQQVVGGAKQLPPQPTLKLSHKENSIVLSWTMAKTSAHEAIASYQLFAYQESNQPPSPSLWKKVGSVKALELPMACTLTQFMPGHRYHFTVRAVDAKSRLGPFSDPRSIRLEK